MKALVLVACLVVPTFAGMLSSDSGRYVFGQINDYRSDQYMLDTQTGRLWKIAIKQDSSFVLVPVSYDMYLDDQAFASPDSAIKAESFTDEIRRKVAASRAKQKE